MRTNHRFYAKINDYPKTRLSSLKNHPKIAQIFDNFTKNRSPWDEDALGIAQIFENFPKNSRIFQEFQHKLTDIWKVFFIRQKLLCAGILT